MRSKEEVREKLLNLHKAIQHMRDEAETGFVEDYEDKMGFLEMIRDHYIMVWRQIEEEENAT